MNLKTAVKTLSASVVFAAATIAVPMAMNSASTILGSALTFGTQAHAQDDQEQEETRKTPAMSEAMFKKFGKVAELGNPEEEGVEPNLEAALAELNEIRDDCDKCNKYEKAMMYNYYGWLYYALEQPQKSIDAYKNLLAQSPEIPMGLELSTMYRVAQLNYAEENYAEALKWLTDWMGVAVNINAEAYVMRAQIYYQTGDSRNALIDINRAVSMTEENGKVPKEGWYNLQRALYVDKEEYKTGAEILEKMLVHYPKVPYWRQLSQLYGALGRDKDQLYVLDALYVAGLLDGGPDMKNLALLLLSEGVPYKAAKILKEGIDADLIEDSSRNLEILANSLRMAQEIKESIPVMARAAEKSDTGDLYAQLAAIYVDADDNKKAVEAAESALEIGKVKRPGNLYLIKGTAHFNLDDYDAAIEAFEEAAQIKETGVQDTAERWLEFVIDERRRMERIREAESMPDAPAPIPQA